MHRPTLTYARLLSIAWLGIALLSGCASTPAALPPPAALSASAASGTAAPQTPPAGAGPASLQPTLDRLAAIVQSGEAEQARALVDPAHPSLQRIVAGLAEELHTLVLAEPLLPSFAVLALNERAPGLAEALVERAWDQRRYYWLFRELDGQWLLSQATPAELGQEQRLHTDTLTLRFQAWDAQLAAALLPQFVAARSHVLTTLGISADSPISVTLRSALGPGDSGGKGSFSLGPTPARDRIEVLSAGVGFGSFGSDETWEQALSAVFAHEYTHRVNDRAPELLPSATMPSWMTEGLAEYVAGQEHLKVPAFRRILADTPLSLCALGAENPNTPRGVLYGFSQQAVTYIVEQRGGLAAFWDLAALYRSAPGGGKERTEQVVMTYWGERCENFDQAWHAWMRDRARQYE